MYQVYRSGELRGMKIAYPAGEGVVIWRPIGADIEDSGPCFDLPVEEVAQLIELGLLLQAASADPYQDVEIDDDDVVDEPLAPTSVPS